MLQKSQLPRKLTLFYFHPPAIPNWDGSHCVCVCACCGIVRGCDMMPSQRAITRAPWPLRLHIIHSEPWIWAVVFQKTERRRGGEEGCWERNGGDWRGRKKSSGREKKSRPGVGGGKGTCFPVTCLDGRRPLVWKFICSHFLALQMERKLTFFFCLFEHQ